MTPAPGTVLRRSILLWGLGSAALGDRGTAVGWLLAETIGLAVVVIASLSLANTTWYLLPFILGAAFIGTWGFQAVDAFHRAQRRQGAIAPAPRGSPAAAMAWLTIPILVWGAGFWLIGAEGASPAAVLDHFVSEWPALDGGRPDWGPSFASNLSELDATAGAALADLAAECSAGQLKADCSQASVNLLRDVRVRITSQDATSASAVAELVEYEKRPTTVLWVFSGTDLVPVVRARLLRIDLRAVPVEVLGLELGARRWQIASAARP